MSEIAGNASLAVIMAVFNFFKALKNLGFFYNTSLNAEINNDFYRQTYGGLPSRKDRSRYPLINEDDAADRAKSEHYKDLLNGYSSDDGECPLRVFVIKFRKCDRQYLG